MSSVFIVNDSAVVAGGADEVAILSAARLADAGVAVHFVYGRGEIDSRLLAAGVVMHGMESIPFKVAGGLGGAVRGIFDARVFWRTWRLFRAAPSGSVVHVHSWFASLSGSVFLAAQAAGLPVVLTLHDYLAACPNGTLFDYRERRICRRLPLSPACMVCDCDRTGRFQKWWRVARQVVLRSLVGYPSSAAAIVHISETQRLALRPSRVLGRNTLRLFNPVRTSENMEGPAPDSEDAFAFVGRLCVEKAPEFAAQVCARHGFALRIYGDGELRDAVVLPGSRVEVMGWMAPAVLMQALAKARALIFPSRWYEGQPLTPLEALCMGVPIVVSDACAAREYVMDGENGYVFKCDDEQDLYEKLLLLKDDATRRKLSLGARKWARENIPPFERHVYTLKALYGSLKVEAL